MQARAGPPFTPWQREASLGIKMLRGWAHTRVLKPEARELRTCSLDLAVEVWASTQEDTEMSALLDLLALRAVCFWRRWS